MVNLLRARTGFEAGARLVPVASDLTTPRLDLLA